MRYFEPHYRTSAGPGILAIRIQLYCPWYTLGCREVVRGCVLYQAVMHNGTSHNARAQQQQRAKLQASSMNQKIKRVVCRVRSPKICEIWNGIASGSAAMQARSAPVCVSLWADWSSERVHIIWISVRALVFPLQAVQSIKESRLCGRLQQRLGYKLQVNGALLAEVRSDMAPQDTPLPRERLLQLTDVVPIIHGLPKHAGQRAAPRNLNIENMDGGAVLQPPIAHQAACEGLHEDLVDFGRDATLTLRRRRPAEQSRGRERGAERPS